MSTLSRSAEEYLAMRRGLGYTLRQEGRMLASFVEYMERRGITRLTLQAALGWATEPAHESPTWWAKRLSVVRGFASYLQSVDEDTEVPPKGLLASGPSRLSLIHISEPTR